MAEFALLPEKIQKLAAKQIDPTSIVVCAIGGVQLFQPDFSWLLSTSYWSWQKQPSVPTPMQWFVLIWILTK